MDYMPIALPLSIYGDAQRLASHLGTSRKPFYNGRVSVIVSRPGMARAAGGAAGCAGGSADWCRPALVFEGLTRGPPVPAVLPAEWAASDGGPAGLNRLLLVSV
jgi:hypothetical protein